MAIRQVQVNHKYLYLFVRSAYGQFQALSIGCTVPGIGRDHILHLFFGLPPLAGQHRIVSKVDHLIALCDKLEIKLKQSQTDSDQLMDAMVQNVLAA